MPRERAVRGAVGIPVPVAPSTVSMDEIDRQLEAAYRPGLARARAVSQPKVA